MEKPLPVPPFQFPVSSIPRRAMGYDRDATNHVFSSLAASYEQLWHEHEGLLDRLTDLESQLANLRDAPVARDALEERVAELEAELERVRADEPLLREALVDAHRVANETVDEARREAEAIVAQARAEAEALSESRLRELRAQEEEAAGALAAERLRAAQELEAIRELARSTQTELSSFLRDAIARAQLNGDGAYAVEPEPEPFSS